MGDCSSEGRAAHTERTARTCAHIVSDPTHAHTEPGPWPIGQPSCWPWETAPLRAGLHTQKDDSTHRGAQRQPTTHRLMT
eukprot:1159010-Pelagomonas_calceolata.AAC.16